MNDLSHPNVVQLVGVSADFKSDNPQNFYFGCEHSTSTPLVSAGFCYSLSIKWMLDGLQIPSSKDYEPFIILTFMKLQHRVGAVQRQSAKEFAEEKVFLCRSHEHVS